MAVAQEKRRSTIKSTQRHGTDSGSPEVQIALLTQKIDALSDHLKGHVKDHHGRRGLVMMVGKRNRLLRYLVRTDEKRYQAVIDRHGLRK